MKTVLTYVTPKMAREWLKSNTDNRPLRPHVVSGLMGAWQRGEWRVTHQGLAFAKSGRLLDGQHRLSFIAELAAGVEVPLNVTTDMEENAFEAIDIGVKRSMTDIYGASVGLVSVGRFVAKIFNSSSTDGMTNQLVKPFMDWVQPEYESLMTFCGRNVRVWSSAPFRAAAIIQIKRGFDEDFVKVAYASLVNADIESMPYAARAVMQQHMNGKLGSARSLDLFCRGLRVFDSTNTRRVTSILIKDQPSMIDEARKFITRETKKSPASAGQAVAKPSAKFNWKKAA